MNGNTGDGRDPPGRTPLRSPARWGRHLGRRGQDHHRLARRMTLRGTHAIREGCEMNGGTGGGRARRPPNQQGRGMNGIASGGRALGGCGNWLNDYREGCRGWVR
jgi:hypothetical protein